MKTVSQDQVDSTIQSTRWNNFSWSWAGRVCRAGGRHTQVSSHTGVLRCQSFTISDQRWIQQVYTVGDSLFSRFNRITRLGLGCTSLRIHWQWRARYSGASDRFAVVPEPDTGGYFPAIYRKQRANLKKKRKRFVGALPRVSRCPGPKRSDQYSSPRDSFHPWTMDTEVEKKIVQSRQHLEHSKHAGHYLLKTGCSTRNFEKLSWLNWQVQTQLLLNRLGEGDISRITNCGIQLFNQSMS